MNMNQWLKANPRNMARGAPMGCPSDDIDEGTLVHVEQLKWVDGDYDPSGTYWGYMPGLPMFAIWADVDGQRLCRYCRAKDREHAVQHATEAGLVALQA